MKFRIFDKRWKFFFAVFGVVIVLCLGIVTYMSTAEPKLSGCHAVIRVVEHAKGATTQRLLLVNIIPDRKGNATVLLNGSFFYNDTYYTINRALVIAYQREGRNYKLEVKDIIKKPQDTLADESMNHSMLIFAKTMYMRVEKVDSSHYLFIDNVAPVFVCTTLS
ncbi:TPA: hypothetical protein JHJ70_003608 [Serratia marcescens]|nr:hypothetical protein [Serratia marcescens]HAV2137650.1 hypothetical protein [Serratia marcescens]